jgi:fructokinase
MTDQLPFFAGVELGGTKAIVVVGQGRELLERASVATGDAATTLTAISELLATMTRRYPIAALGIASFGPLGVDPAQSDYGVMLPTPKAGWSGAAILTPLVPALDTPVAIHTDVTAAALAEMRWGAAEGCSDVIYTTLGTGVGMGIIANGEPVAGTMHPEAGHLRVRRLAGDSFAGTCPFHGACLEGLASGTAVAARAGVAASELANDSPHWLPVIDALAEAFATLVLTLSPQRIIVGGGLGVGQPHLLPRVRAAMLDKLAGYHPRVTQATIDALLVPAALGGDAGPLGALCLAEMALHQRPA